MKRLYIDLDQCSKCEDCGLACSYAGHPDNDGIRGLRELAHFAVMCRRCDDAPCVNACPWEALEMQPANILKRYGMRCTACKSCSNACPFGVIYPATIPLVFKICDYCVSRLAEGEAPACVGSCPHGGVKYGDFEEDLEKHIYRVSDNLVVFSDQRWTREEEKAVKK